MSTQVRENYEFISKWVYCYEDMNMWQFHSTDKCASFCGKSLQFIQYPERLNWWASSIVSLGPSMDCQRHDPVLDFLMYFNRLSHRLSRTSESRKLNNCFGLWWWELMTQLTLASIVCILQVTIYLRHRCICNVVPDNWSLDKCIKYLYHHIDQDPATFVVVQLLLL